jgi:hypothetical protein
MILIYRVCSFDLWDQGDEGSVEGLKNDFRVARVFHYLLNFVA